MTPNLWIQHIRDDRQLSKLFNQLTMDERRVLYTETNGDLELLAKGVKAIKKQRGESRLDLTD